MNIRLYGDTDYRLLLLLGRAGDMLSKVRRVELDQYHISPIEALALFCISEIGNGETPAEVSRKMRRRHNTVTALLGRMEKKGLLTRTRNAERNGTWRIDLTAKGEVICRQAVSLSSVHGVMSNFSEGEKLELESYLKTICDNANVQLNKATMGD